MTENLQFIVYVDVIIITSNDSDEINKLKAYLSLEFEMKDLKLLKYYLGMEVAKGQKGNIHFTKKICHGFTSWDKNVRMQTYWHPNGSQQKAMNYKRWLRGQQKRYQ